MCDKDKKLQRFIDKSILIHGDKYDYSKVIYDECYKKVIIICKVHEEFEQPPYSHLQGKGCKSCGIIYRSANRTSTTEQFISKAKSVHGDKYDYSKVEYLKSSSKIIIICKKHGEFYQNPNSHLKNGGCNKCGTEITGIKQRNNLNDFIVKAKKIYGDKYDYSKVEYVISSKKVIIICQKHGDFYVTPNHFISHNSECPKSALKNYSKQSINYFKFIS